MMRFFRTQMEANRRADEVPGDGDTHVVSQPCTVELMVSGKELGFTTFTIQSASPFDGKTAERSATEIRPLVDAD